MKPTIFISHSSNDSHLVDRFLDFLTAGLGIAPQAIFCSSSIAAIPLGHTFVEDIKQHMREAKLVVVLLTNDYLRSKFCLAEMGAAWALNHAICPIVVPPLGFRVVEDTPLKGMQAVILQKYESLVIFVEKLRAHGFSPAPLVPSNTHALELLRVLEIMSVTTPHTPSVNISGILDFKPRRAELTPNWWNDFYNPNLHPQHVYMMGQSMGKAFQEPFCDIFYRWCLGGTRMHILYLAPDASIARQILQVSQEITYGGNSGMKLLAKIMDSIENLNRKVISRIADLHMRPTVRFATCDLPFSMMAVDEKMVVTLYGAEAEADNSSTFIIEGKESEAFKRFLAEFTVLWLRHSKIFPYEDPLLKYLKQDWRSHLLLRNTDAAPPPPRQAILYPTYRCSAGCSFCMYKGLLGKGKEMNFKTLERVLSDLLASGVDHIEISGGGEPTEYSKFAEMLFLLRKTREKYPLTRFGLLTNGRYLSRFDSDELVLTFNEYIRVSRSEASKHESSDWRDNVKGLLAAKLKTGAPCKVSVKYLLTLSGVNDFVEMVREDLQDPDFVNIDYFRFGSERNVPLAQISHIEQQVWQILNYEGDIDCERKVCFSMSPVEYARNFKCWISPISVVIDPEFYAYLCCNYYRDEHAKRLGDLKVEPLMQVWRGEKHKRLRKNLSAQNCERKYYCNCRFAELQSFIDRAAAATGEST